MRTIIDEYHPTALISIPKEYFGHTIELSSEYLVEADLHKSYAIATTIYKNQLIPIFAIGDNLELNFQKTQPINEIPYFSKETPTQKDEIKVCGIYIIDEYEIEELSIIIPVSYTHLTLPTICSV